MNKVKFINSSREEKDGLYITVRGSISVIVFLLSLNTRLNIATYQLSVKAFGLYNFVRVFG